MRRFDLIGSKSFHEKLMPGNDNDGTSEVGCAVPIGERRNARRPIAATADRRRSNK